MNAVTDDEALECAKALRKRLDEALRDVAALAGKVA
jgi:hypothetical protein